MLSSSEQFVEAVEEMSIEDVRTNFFALFQEALTIGEIEDGVIVADEEDESRA